MLLCRKKETPGLQMVHTRDESDAADILWELLIEREPHQHISFVMPSRERHEEFVKKPGYRIWHLIRDGDIHEYVGSIYLTVHGEIGLWIFKKHQGKGYGTWAVQWLMARFVMLHHVANVAPTNPQSQKFFEKLGFVHVQNTLIRREVPKLASDISDSIRVTPPKQRMRGKNKPKKDHSDLV